LDQGDLERALEWLAGPPLRIVDIYVAAFVINRIARRAVKRSLTKLRSGAVWRSASAPSRSCATSCWSSKTTPSEQYRIGRVLRERLKIAFDEEGIEIPFPQQTVWHRSVAA
jgi:small conductance mechanosensitive channel